VPRENHRGTGAKRGSLGTGAKRESSGYRCQERVVGYWRQERVIGVQVPREGRVYVQAAGSAARSSNAAACVRTLPAVLAPDGRSCCRTVAAAGHVFRGTYAAV